MSRFIKFFLLTLILLVSGGMYAGNYSFRTASRLSEGLWVKVRMSETGVYRLTYDEVKAMGFSDPSQVRLYGYGGAQLSDRFYSSAGDSTKADDLPLVPVLYSNPANRLVSPGDQLLFWGQGTVSWIINSDNTFTHSYNTYSSYGYYFLSDRSIDQSVLINDASNHQASLPYNGSVVPQTNFIHPVFHDRDEVTIAKSGRIFFGESFQYQTSQSFRFAIPDLEEGQHKVAVNFVAKTGGNTLRVVVNGQAVASGSWSNSADNLVAVMVSPSAKFTTPAGTTSIDVALTLSRSGDPKAYLDYILINAQRTLKLNNGFLHFRCPVVSGAKTQFKIEGATPETQIWNVSDPNRPKQITGAQLNGSELSFIAERNQYSEYVAFDYSAPKNQLTFDSSVANQNLHALSQADYFIVAPAEFLPMAEQLADYHRRHSGLRVTVVTDRQVYNEYSSGVPDAMAYRWFLKQFYDRASSVESEKPAYFLLFGDCSVDNRGTTKLYETSGLRSIPLLPSYQQPESLNEWTEIMTDDFFAYLDDTDGTLPHSGTVNLGVGRFPVRTRSEAQTVVDKAIRYMSNPEKGNWKNLLTLLAEDGDGGTHLKQAETMAQTISSNPVNKGFVYNKIYYDNYVPEISGGNKRFPEVERQLLSTLNSGTLMLNYIGHGSPTAMSKSIVMTQATVSSLYNSRLPLWITATCDFSRFDEYITSIGELAFLNPKGGAIALFSTTRIAFTGSNEMINTAFCKHVFDKKPDGQRLRLGDILRLTKNSISNHDKKLNFALLGDPALKLGYPEYGARVTKINEEPVDETQEVDFKALAKITVEGEILDPSGQFDESFTGMIVPQVYDVEMNLKSLGIGNPAETYLDRSLILFSGRDSVRNGRFKFSFFMPRDISYQNGAGLINFYAYDNRNNEAQGYFSTFRVGGTDHTAVNDHAGPDISPIYLNATDFQNGGMVNETPTFYAYMSDPKGFNLSTWAVGHDMNLTIDDDYAQTYSLNKSFECVSGSATEGFVKFKIPALSEGAHTLTFRAWDTFNNSSTAVVDFEVKNGYRPRIFDLSTDRNPVSVSRDGQARFFLSHNRPNVEITVKVSVFDLNGMEVWSSVEKGVSDIFDAYPLTWDLSVQNGTKAYPGIYIYRAIVTTDSISQATQSRKIAIIN